MQMAGGEFWDGALGFPLPAKLAEWEANRIWPSGTKTDIVISLGTGEEPKPRRSAHSLSRLWHSFMDFLGGTYHYKDLRNGLGQTQQREILRLDTRLNESIQLDDVSRLQVQREGVQLAFDAREGVIEAATALLFSSFYFELDYPLAYDSGVYYCQGSIYCRGNCRLVLDALSKLCPSKLEFITDKEVLSECRRHDDICHVCHRYRKCVSFTVRHPEDIVTISLRANGSVCRRISGFPQNTAWFQAQQGFDQRFGTSDHDTPGRIRCVACRPSNVLSRKRRISMPVEMTAKRLRR